jgi:mRNA interferase YafQ
MKKLVVTAKFRRAFRKFVKQDAILQKRVENALSQLAIDVTVPSLETHKLGGKLKGLQACSCGYDCRIVFSLSADSETKEEIILLLDVGTHDEVY